MKALRIGLSICILTGCVIDGYYYAPEDPRPGEALWVNQLGSEVDESGVSIALDGEDNLIAVGVFDGTLLAGTELTSSGDKDIYVIKLNSSTGGVIWAKRLGGTFADYVSSLAIDGSNNIYIVGRFRGTVDFGGGPLMAAGQLAAFVLKLDADGSFGWAQATDARISDGAIATDGDTVVVALAHDGWVTVDKLSASTGATSWNKLFWGPRIFGGGVALDRSGNVVFTGSFSGTVDFGGSTLSTSSTSGFLAKLAGADGAHLLSKQFGQGQRAAGAAVAVDPANNIFLMGDFTETADLGCTDILTAPQALFLAKYTQAGSCVWAKEFGGAVTMHGQDAYGIAVNNAGDVAATGAFCGSISFGGETLSSASACDRMDMFAARFSGDGTHLKSVRAGGTEVDRGLGIAQSSDGRFFVTGEFAGFTEFGGDSFNSAGSSDAFIAAYAPL